MYSFVVFFFFLVTSWSVQLSFLIICGEREGGRVMSKLCGYQ